MSQFLAILQITSGVQLGPGEYLKFTGSAVIQEFIPGTNITKKYVLEKFFSFEILFNKNLQKINPYYYKIKKYIYRYTRCWRDII